MIVRTRNIVILTFLTALFLSSCSSHNPDRQVWFKMDTVVEITLFANKNAKVTSEEIFEKIQIFLHDWDERFSPNSQTSEILKINTRQTDTAYIGDDLYEMLKISLLYSQKTDGFFDISVKPLKDFWNISGEGDFLPDPEDSGILDTLSQILRAVGFQKISLIDNPKRAVFENSDTQIDLGAIAKGFAIEKLADTLKYYGFTNFIINVGGDIFVSGERNSGRPIVVGVRHPRRRSDLLHVFGIGGEGRFVAIFTSGDYERFRYAESGVRVHHIFNPKTGFSQTGNISLTVKGESAVVSDILSTAFFGFGADEIRSRMKAFDGYGFILVDKDENVIFGL